MCFVTITFAELSRATQKLQTCTFATLSRQALLQPLSPKAFAGFRTLHFKLSRGFVRRGPRVTPFIRVFGAAHMLVQYAARNEGIQQGMKQSSTKSKQSKQAKKQVNTPRTMCALSHFVCQRPSQGSGSGFPSRVPWGARQNLWLHWMSSLKAPGVPKLCYRKLHPPLAMASLVSSLEAIMGQNIATSLPLQSWLKLVSKYPTSPFSILSCSFERMLIHLQVPLLPTAYCKT